VEIPGADGRAGMAAVSLDGELNLSAFRTHLIDRLPGYARPLFLRIRNEIDVTNTFKYLKADLIRQGYDPLASTEAIYFNHPGQQAFVRLDKAFYDCIQLGQVPLGQRRAIARNETIPAESAHLCSERSNTGGNGI
jgi:fatty-acyl-CoA synthase